MPSPARSRGSRPSTRWRAAIPALRLALRVGLSTGVATSEEDDWFGTPVVEAARLCTAAGPSQILASEAVRLLVDDEAGISFVGVGGLELKGFPEPRHGLRSAVAASRRGGSVVPTVAGPRRHGQRTLADRVDGRRAVWATRSTRRAPAPRRTVLVAGVAGIGKTRVVAEAVRDLGDTAVLACSWSETRRVPRHVRRAPLVRGRRARRRAAPRARRRCRRDRRPGSGCHCAPPRRRHRDRDRPRSAPST